MIHRCFPKDFYIKFEIPNYDELLEFCEKKTEVNNEKFTWGADCNLDRVPLDAEETSSIIGPSVQQFAKILKKDFGCYSSDPWINHYTRGSYQEVHSHSENDFASVFLLNDGEEFSQFYFYNEVPMAESRWSHVVPEIANSQIYPMLTEGEVIFFPGWLQHGVTPHKSDIVRKTLACNYNFAFN